MKRITTKKPTDYQVREWYEKFSRSEDIWRCVVTIRGTEFSSASLRMLKIMGVMPNIPHDIILIPGRDAGEEYANYRVQYVGIKGDYPEELKAKHGGLHQVWSMGKFDHTTVSRELVQMRASPGMYFSIETIDKETNKVKESEEYHIYQAHLYARNVNAYYEENWDGKNWVWAIYPIDRRWKPSAADLKRLIDGLPVLEARKEKATRKREPDLSAQQFRLDGIAAAERLAGRGVNKLEIGEHAKEMGISGRSHLKYRSLYSDEWAQIERAFIEKKNYRKNVLEKLPGIRNRKDKER